MVIMTKDKPIKVVVDSRKNWGTQRGADAKNGRIVHRSPTSKKAGGKQKEKMRQPTRPGLLRQTLETLEQVKKVCLFTVNGANFTRDCRFLALFHSLVFIKTSFQPEFERPLKQKTCSMVKWHTDSNGRYEKRASKSNSGNSGNVRVRD